MNLVYVGKIVNTHGIKGEVKIISDFEYKDQIFKIGNKIFVDDETLEINSYRVHKNYDMITLKGFNDINEVLKYKNCRVYINRDDYEFELLTTDLIGMKVYDNSVYKGEVIDILKSDLYSLLKIKNKKVYLIPNIDTFIKKINKEEKIIEINYMKGLEDED